MFNKLRVLFIIIFSAILIEVTSADTISLVAVGSGGGIFSTTDGGATWTGQQAYVQLSPTTGLIPNFTDVVFTDSSHGCAVGSGGGIFSTTDGGATWTGQQAYVQLSSYQGLSPNFADVVFTDSSHGCAVGSGGGIFSTTDGGATWTGQKAYVQLSPNTGLSPNFTAVAEVPEPPTLVSLCAGSINLLAYAWWRRNRVT
jgi:photosystem II stability/assembly factor-like uncharacterized protein